MKTLSSTHLANIEFHRVLAPHYKKQPFFRDSNLQRVRAILQEMAQSTPDGRLLDVGCGTGLILDVAQDLFRELDGIDITPEMLNRVTPRANVKTHLASAESLPFPANSFDVVTAYSVLHHIEDLGPVFREVRRTLKPGGFFYADESPSQHFLDALLGLTSDQKMTDPVRLEYQKITSDAAEYEKEYGLPVDVVYRAMAQNYAWHALREENLRRLLTCAGFETVQITFRRFLGEDQCRREGGEELVNTIQNYLTSMLPLTRDLFKYFVLIAR